MIPQRADARRSPMLDAVRIIVEDEPQLGSWNMAIDEVLLESALQRGICTVRWYRWSEPTLSLGYFQKPETVEIPAPLDSLPVVRRLTGGGAIVHHREWTYSCAIPQRSHLSGDPGALYGLLHEVMIDALRKRGINVSLRGMEAAHEGKDFLCFTRGDANDVVLAGHKVIGSAQRRRRGAILQHGSLLWRKSEYAPELLGICDLAEEPGDPSDLLFEMVEGMGELFGKRLFEIRLTEEEMERAAEIAMAS